MSDVSELLDTPKRKTLQSRSIEIRAALKDFERAFAINNDGRKPSKDDIKADADISIKYKEYSKIRDVLAGKLDYAVLVEQPKSPSRRKHARTDSGISFSPRKRGLDATPRRSARTNQYNVFDAPDSASPKPLLFHAIGPTPQRDGKVLGLFDLLSNSAHSSKATPSSRKRKLEALVEEDSEEPDRFAVAQTPSQRKSHRKGDLLKFLDGTPGKTPETGHRKHSRTPVSEGRKFMLSQFFATPSTVRYSNVGAENVKGNTPLRDRILGRTPDTKIEQTQLVPDATPAYLRRSTSFKDRLLSASRPMSGSNSGMMSPPMTSAGPPTLQHFRSVSSLFSDLAANFPDIVEEDERGDEHEDDLEALREIEDSQLNVIVKDSQQQRTLVDEDTENIHVQDGKPLQKVYKKKGQKRTTRRAIVRPGKGQSASQPQFVAAGGASDDEENFLSVDQNNLDGQSIDQEDFQPDDHDFDDADLDDSDFERNGKNKPKKVLKEKVAAKEKPKKTATINPNAVSHMNFRTLKIKNKNSKAKGKGRFGRGRR